MKLQQLTRWLLGGFGALGLALPQVYANERSTQESPPEVRVRIVAELGGRHRPVPAVVWLDPLSGTSAVTFPPGRHYTLLQKNRTFIPHLQVVPVGSSVQFPNADPFFHNVFSLFDGKRFDLGLYEAGSSKSVTFSSEGVSYIFCNIHPEMSAVVISVPTELYGIADANDSIIVRNIPSGDYKMQVWVEGVPRSFLQHLTRIIHVDAGITNLGELKVPIPDSPATHTNEFGRMYDQESKPPY
jgi:hypothetical protein